MTISSLLVLLIYGFVFTWLTIPRVAEIVRKYKIFRKPTERDLHWRFVPKLTGVSFYVALLVVAFAFVPFVDVQRLMLILGAGAIVIYIGIRDDIYQLRPAVKLVLQLVAIAFFAFGDDLVVRNLHGFLNIYEIPTGFDYFLTFFIGVFMINAFNLCDGIDGLAAMLGIIISSCYGAIFYIIGDYLLLSFCVILIGCLLAFLRFNLPHKNKVFMGDTGSLFLGFLFYLFTMYFVTNQSVILSVFVPHKSLVALAALCIFIVPILDSGSVFFSRAWHKKSPFRPDNNHVHHLVLHFTKNHVMASLIIVASFTTTLVLFSQLAFTIGHEDTAIVFLVYLVVWYVVLFFIRRRVREERFR
jgi:UDP-N-acetylmuramyl pentapeptide phosphotransferase/UDP-N-acetylglucosamine-1-phosphate transferase